ncbi:hypothetical protein [Ferrimonas balearica]|uniref:hypothetical protein n=1 Tax=Ferrimonas balearica TaxID=44012 RepID=UPI001C990A4D|nr:hypothetical protein [Ferrimonas balearica]MBY5923344.1 hypothetical protein [Ferrimonas balearica]MBY5995302.1 hypothetical protein [Ferrimonas balearica]
MTNASECVILRCAQFGQQERALFSLLQSAFGEGAAFIAVDSTEIEGEANICCLPDYVKTHRLDVGINRLGWRCGDHCFYGVYERRSDFDYYWLIESDVYADSEALKKLTAESRSRTEDLLIHRFRELEPSATWARHYHRYYDETSYGGFFPLVRLSNRAVAYLQSERVALAQRYDGSRFYPNDESFVCGRLANHGFSCASLNLTRLGKFNLIRKLRKHVEKGLLHHPVYDDIDEVVTKEKRFIRKNFYRLRWGQLYRSLKAIHAENNGDMRLVMRHLLSIFV